MGIERTRLCLFHFAAIAALSTDLHASAAPLCTIESLSDNCKIFEKYPAIIKTSETTFILNPLPAERIKADTLQAIVTKPNSEIEAEEDQLLDAKMDFIETLKSEPDFSEKFKITLSTMIGQGVGFPLQILDGKIVERAPDRKKGEYKIDTVIILPLPANDERGKMKRVTTSDFLDQINRLRPQTKEALLKLSKVNSERPSLGSGMGSAGGFDGTSQAESRSVKRYAEVKALFDQGKKDIAARLREMGRETGRVFDFEALAKKIDRIQIAENFIMQSENKSCRNGPNAFYTPGLHTVSFCESILRMPDVALLGTIGHEIGHALDPCYGCAGLHEIDDTDPPKINQPYKKWQKMSLFAEPLEFRFGTEVTRKAKELDQFRTISKPFSRDTYPFRREADCLTKTNRLRQILVEDIPGFVETLVNDRKSTHGFETPKQEVQEIIQKLSVNPDCISGFGFENSVNESVADLFASTLRAKELKRSPPKTDLDKLIPVALYLEPYCADRSQQDDIFVSERNSTAAELSRELLNRSKSRLQVHDTGINRMNRSYLGHPDIASALGCTPSATAKCYDRLIPQENMSRPRPSGSMDPDDSKSNMIDIPSPSGVKQ